MATFIERIDEESNYTKVINVLKETFEDGEILNKQELIRRFMEYYQTNVDEATMAVKLEFDRAVTNLRQYSKLKQLGKGQYRVCLKINPKEEHIHTKKSEKTIE